ncbi:DUF1937 family protein [Mesorhizobium kowhaii]|uniref:DUF1937 domain-containing protein n=1 Tax=Mesorhizobium kowhaii TaxID=1300272 RepID=A0A2W7C910_9HYPH|nr:DUF1937 family protein [Mesorhizobium kowhaii]PZV38821.1 hypothetical protein B5V02_09205 [Mesorhizobium kowhaii]
MRKIFLACPYGHADKSIVEKRFEASNAVAAQIARSGSVVFSQVSMSHPINKHLADLDKVGIGSLWAPIDQVFLEAMDELIVVDEPGWKESAGIAREIEFFSTRDRRVSLWSDVKTEFA